METKAPETKQVFIDKLNEEAWSNRRSELRSSYKKSILAEEESIAIDYQPGLMHALKAQGYCLWRFSDYSNSLDKSRQALDLAEKLGDLKSKADILNSIGAVYMFLEEHHNRLKCNQECYEIRKAIGDTEGMLGSLNNLGETYMQMGQLNKAIECFKNCLNSAHLTDQIAGWNYHNLGLIEFQKGNIDKSIENFKSSIEACSVSGYQILECDSFLQLGKAYKEGRNFKKAEEAFNNALNIATGIDAKEELQNIYLELSKLKEHDGDIHKAFEYFKKYNQYHLEVYNEENDRIITNLKHQYEVEALQKETEFQKLKNIELKKAYSEIENQKDIILKHNISIMDSIEYARHIQKALLTSDENWERIGQDYFILFFPKDVVSGDYYWCYSPEDQPYSVWITADCTGHGVPGAFMSMLGIGFLNDIVIEGGIFDSAKILNILRQKIISVLEEKKTIQPRYDGMDVSVCVLNRDTKQLEFSGAFNGALIVTQNPEGKTEHIENESIIAYKNNYLIPVDANRFPVGKSPKDNVPFDKKIIQLDRSDIIYTYSDGYSDQFGGPDRKKFMALKFRELLLEICELPFNVQYKKLETVFNNWKNESDQEQIDDVTVIGVRV